MTRKISFNNQKGGCGKTTTAISVAAGLARRGRDTLLIDGDPHGSAGYQIRPTMPYRNTLFDILENCATVESAVEPTAFKNLSIIRSDERMKDPDILLSDDDSERLGIWLSEPRFDTRKPFDYIILDSQPSASRLREGLTLMADSMVIPLFAEAASINGLVGQLSDIQRWAQRRWDFMGKESFLLGAVVTNYISHHSSQRSTLPLLKAALEARDIPLLAVIPQSGAVTTAADTGVPIPWAGKLKSYAIYKAYEKLASAIEHAKPEPIPVHKETVAAGFEEDITL